MPYLIDGHNLIPKLGLRLDSMEDERQELRQQYEQHALKRANRNLLLVLSYDA